jgi:glycerol-3-phosphate dehydrogenase
MTVPQASAPLHVDIAIIGGGINGCGIARDAAGRGLSVYLCEMNDLASGTSSWSTKLIHGGLRYLEHYEFRLVREALKEREVLWANAPHIIHPLRFVLPYRKGLRPAWMLRLGLFLYDTLGGRKKLPGTRVLDLAQGAIGAPLQTVLRGKGFEYSDCFVDDARLVALNAMDARARGATIAVQTKAIGAKRAGDGWDVTVEDRATHQQKTIRARALINAAGPWVGAVLASGVGVNARAKVRLVQGSHIVVRKLFDHDRAYILQNADGRIVFAIPYQGDFTLIGTTDRDYAGDPAKVHATAEEIDYLCTAISQDFALPITPADVVWSYSGVRPLYDDGASEAKAATRDYVFELDQPRDGAPLLSIFGGKITTYRRLAEAALDQIAANCAPTLAAALTAQKGWTARVALPGGDFAVDGKDAQVRKLTLSYPFLALQHARRLVDAYGTLAVSVLGTAQSAADLGRAFGGTLTEAEVRYLMQHEWARTADDVIWRRSKLGLRLTPGEISVLDAWMRTARMATAAADAL